MAAPADRYCAPVLALAWSAARCTATAPAPPRRPGSPGLSGRRAASHLGTVGLKQGIPLRDVQRLSRHARPETTLASYDISGDALEWHASHPVVGLLAGWAS
jgi:hypothetical protein